MKKFNDCDVFIIRALTNMHVGSGDINFGVIDNMVQRDATTNYPCIHGSSLKGALREHFKMSSKIDDDKVKIIFGAEASSEPENGNASGNYKFFQARLLAIPVRSMNQPYYLATCPYIIKEFIEYNEQFGNAGKLASEFKALIELDLHEEPGYLFDEKLANEKKVKVEIEDMMVKVVNPTKYKIQVEAIKRIFGFDKLVVLNDKMFNQFISSNLPVIARNYLENRVSKNLWYEEIVPRETLFYVGIWKQDNGKTNTVEFEEISNILQEDVIQIGANASIGYGYTKFRKLGGE